ncbi:hypothetical protein FRB95_003511 [Tulasnella sp. JGI-2019a]|nr:hypothetical protein FRB95_003511 [Tulasnella sp. JGI-2019a]
MNYPYYYPERAPSAEPEDVGDEGFDYGQSGSGNSIPRVVTVNDRLFPSSASSQHQHSVMNPFAHQDPFPNSYYTPPTPNQPWPVQPSYQFQTPQAASAASQDRYKGFVDATQRDFGSGFRTVTDVARRVSLKAKARFQNGHNGAPQVIPLAPIGPSRPIPQPLQMGPAPAPAPPPRPMPMPIQTAQGYVFPPTAPPMPSSSYASYRP